MAQGKRFSHYNCMVPADSPALRAATPRRLPALKTEWDSTRTYPVAVVLMQFADRAFSMADPKDFYQRIFNEEGYNEGAGPGCVADYFRQQSCGWFHPRFDILGPVTVKGSYNKGNSTYGSDTFGKAVSQLADSLAIDFSPYDWDGDQWAESIIIVYAGYGGNETSELSEGCIWPNTSTFTTTLTVGEMHLSSYSASAELFTEGKSCGIGTICHEYSHTLGLPDLYPTQGDEYSVCDEWDLMDGGNYADNGWCPPCYSTHAKMLLGWQQPQVLSQPATITDMRPISEGGQAYLVATENPDEFYLLENRQWSGWDQRTPGHGLLVTHVEYSFISWRNNIVNARPNHHRYEYVHADNMDYNQWDDSLQKKNQYIGGHSLYLSTTPYPFVNDTIENRQLTDTSLPAATTYSGTGLLSQPITDITEGADGTISFLFMGGSVSGVSAVINNNEKIINNKVYDLTGRPVATRLSRAGHQERKEIPLFINQTQLIL